MPTPGGNPTGVYANSDGTVWVSEYFANAFALLFPGIAPHTDEQILPRSHGGCKHLYRHSFMNFGYQKGVVRVESPVVKVDRPKFTPGWIEYVIPIANTKAEYMRVDDYGCLWFEGDAGYLGVLNPLSTVFKQYSISTSTVAITTFRSIR